MSKSPKNLFFDETLVCDPNLSSNSYRIYIYLMSIYDEKKSISTVSNNKLSNEVNIPLDKVKESLNTLIKIGYISTEHGSLSDDSDNMYFNFKHKFYLE